MNIDKIRYLSFDLDGTLLNKDGKISTYSKQIIRRLQEEGYTIILNSGRFYHELKDFCEELELSKYGGYAICSNGYLVYDAVAKTIHKNPGISMDDYQAISKLMKQHHLFCFIYDHHTYGAIAKGYWYILLKTAKAFAYVPFPFGERIHRYRLQLQHTAIHHMNSYSTNHELEKLCFIGFPKQLQALSDKINRQFSEYQFFLVNSYSTELVKKGVSKADALANLLRSHNADLSNVMAFGDAGNDIPLLTQAGIGVCMKNAKKHMRQHASYVSEYTNQEDGVAKFMEAAFYKVDDNI